MDREGGNKERMKRCREWISLHFLILQISISYSFSHFLSIFSQPGCQAAASCATLIKTVNHKVTMIFPEYFLFSIYSFLNLSDQTIRSQILLDIFPSRTSNRYLIDPAHHLIYWSDKCPLWKNVPLSTNICHTDRFPLSQILETFLFIAYLRPFFFKNYRPKVNS